MSVYLTIVLWLTVCLLFYYCLLLKRRQDMLINIQEKTSSNLNKQDHGLKIREIIPLHIFSFINKGSDLKHDGEILILLSQTCEACISVMQKLNIISTQQKSTNIKVLIIGTKEEMEDSIQKFNLKNEISHTDLPTMINALKTSILPFAYYMDDRNTVMAKGVVSNEQDFRTLINISKKTIFDN